MKYSKRIQEIPPYPFADLDRKKSALKAKGLDLINLSIGDPDLPTPAAIVEKMKTAVAKPQNHGYPAYDGAPFFKEAVARWFASRFGKTLDPQTEVCALIGSKEGIANLHGAFVDPGEVVLVPSPGYPVYAIGTRFAGGEPYFMPLKKENGFLPDLKAIPSDIARRARLMHLNYPNNPTAALATDDFYAEAVAFAKKHDLMISSDAAYTEIYFDGRKPKSILETAGAKEVAIEFHSLSKTFNMTGWRIGFAVGNPEIVAGLAKIKTNIDSGPFTAVQEAAAFALEQEASLTSEIRHVYQDRRDAFIGALRKIGFDITPSAGTFYLWTEVPSGETSQSFTEKLLTVGVIATPGTAFGDAGRGFIRFTLTAPKGRLLEAANRIGKIL